MTAVMELVAVGPRGSAHGSRRQAVCGTAVNVRSECGIVPANTAQYWPQLNTIYLDEVFDARQAKAAKPS